MPSTTIKVPTLNRDGTRGEREVTGYVVILPVGERKVRFLIHPRDNLPKAEKILTHLASGRRVGSLSSAGVAHMISTGRRLTERGQALHLLQRLITERGLENVLKVLDEAAQTAL